MHAWYFYSSNSRTAEFVQLRTIPFPFRSPCSRIVHHSIQIALRTCFALLSISMFPLPLWNELKTTRYICQNLIYSKENRHGGSRATPPGPAGSSTADSWLWGTVLLEALQTACSHCRGGTAAIRVLDSDTVVTGTVTRTTVTPSQAQAGTPP